MFEVAKCDLVNMGITVVSYTIKDIRDDNVRSISVYQLADAIYVIAKINAPSHLIHVEMEHFVIRF